MKNPYRALSIGAIALITAAVSAPSVSAQIDSGETDWSDYPGIEYAVSRTYLPDFANLEVPEDGEMSFDGMTFTVFGALQFDTDDNAEDALEQVAEELISGIQGESTASDPEPLEHEDLDDDTVNGVLTVDEESLGGVVTVYYIFDQEDEYIFMTAAVAFGDGDDLTDYAVEAIDDLKDARPGDVDDIVVNEDGTSEGGLWDVLPAADAYPEIEGQTASDQLLYPVDEEE